jgi:phosphopantothenoylcysteine synthetase/decarboxylase
MKRKNIILGITASIASYKACDLIGALRKKGHDVTCIMTRDAHYFITPLTLEILTENKVYDDMFKLPDKREVVHVSLAQKADLILICPATADIIAKLASGIADSLLTCVVLASKAPILIAPAMNDNMYKHRITQRNIAELKKTGCEFADPITGRLACGYEAVGHLADIGKITKYAHNLLK